MKRQQMTFIGLISGLSVLGFILRMVMGAVGSYTWPYILNSWLLFMGKTAKVLWWHGFLLGIIPGFGEASIPIAIFTWMAMLFLT